MRLRIFDFIILGAAAVAAVYSGIRIYGGGGSAVRLTVKGGGGSWVYPMDKTERLEVAGPLGITTVELSGGKARIISSPCANQSCIAAGAIHRNGQWTACLPNGVFLSIEGKEPESNGGVDGAAW